jgi:hypothetical protein
MVSSHLPAAITGTIPNTQCRSEIGLVMIGHNTFPPYSLSPNTSMPCYGPCSSRMQYCSTLRTPEHLYAFSSNACCRTAFLNTGINQGGIPFAFIFILLLAILKIVSRSFSKRRFQPRTLHHTRRSRERNRGLPHQYGISHQWASSKTSQFRRNRKHKGTLSPAAPLLQCVTVTVAMTEMNSQFQFCSILDKLPRSHFYVCLTQHAAEQRVNCCSLAPRQNIQSCPSRNRSLLACARPLWCTIRRMSCRGCHQRRHRAKCPRLHVFRNPGSGTQECME